MCLVLVLFTRAYKSRMYHADVRRRRAARGVCANFGVLDGHYAVVGRGVPLAGIAIKCRQTATCVCQWFSCCFSHSTCLFESDNCNRAARDSRGGCLFLLRYDARLAARPPCPSNVESHQHQRNKNCCILNTRSATRGQKDDVWFLGLDVCCPR